MLHGATRGSVQKVGREDGCAWEGDGPQLPGGREQGGSIPSTPGKAGNSSSLTKLTKIKGSKQADCKKKKKVTEETAHEKIPAR